MNPCSNARAGPVHEMIHAKRWRLAALLILLGFTSIAEILRLDHTGKFTIWLDCEKRSAVKRQYNAQRDTGTPNSPTVFILISRYRFAARNLNEQRPAAPG